MEKNDIKQNSKKGTIKNLMEKYKSSMHKLIHDQDDESGLSFLQKFIKSTIRTLAGSIKKFLSDEALLRATSISYSLIVSFVPTLVVIMLVGAKFINKDEYFMIAREFIKKHGIPLDVEPYFNIINELLANSNTVTGVGFIILLFSATSVLRNMESALNTIWKVKVGRPWIQKISGFLLVLIFGPVLLTVGISTAESLIKTAAAPDFQIVRQFDNREITLGQKATWIELDKSKNWIEQDVLSKIDFETQKDPILFNIDEHRTLTAEEREPLLPKTQKSSVQTLRQSTFMDVTRTSAGLLLINDQGDILLSKNNGEIWDIQHYQKENLKLIFNIKFKKLFMLNEDDGVLIGNNGLILYTENGGISWSLAKITIPSANNVNDLTLLPNGKIIAVGEYFSAIASDDHGKTWETASSITALMGKDKENLNRVYKNDNSIWITGDFGTLIQSIDGGANWKRVNIGLNKNHINDILFVDKQNGIIIGDNGMIRYSEDGGETWRSTEQLTTADLHSISYKTDHSSIYIAGTGYTLLQASAKTFNKFNIIISSPFWRKMVNALGNFILPFLVIGLTFFLIYKIMPFTNVSNKAALIGGGVTALLWVLFLWVFRYYASSFSSGTFAIYGTLAAIPLSLLLVYTSVSIILFGAEIGYFIQNPNMLKLTGFQIKMDTEKLQMWRGLKILYVLFNNFQSGKGETKEAELIKICNNDYEEFFRIMEKLEERGFTKKTESNRYIPLVAASNINLDMVIDDIDPADFSVPNYEADDRFTANARRYFNEIKASRKKILDKATFEDLLKA